MIEIDGGVTPETAPALVRAGADVLVAGTAAFRGGPVRLRRQHRRDPGELWRGEPRGVTRNHDRVTVGSVANPTLSPLTKNGNSVTFG